VAGEVEKSDSGDTLEDDIETRWLTLTGKRLSDRDAKQGADVFELAAERGAPDVFWRTMAEAADGTKARPWRWFLAAVRPRLGLGAPSANGVHPPARAGPRVSA
jgi:hypothetical protein